MGSFRIKPKKKMECPFNGIPFTARALAVTRVRARVLNCCCRYDNILLVV